ncbi:MAG TPA: type II toxin-antitoxin system HicA family toxin [Candidatus Paceibacterota bacterium]
MPRLKSSREIIKTLEDFGFQFVSQRGSHIKYTHKSRRRIVIIPANKKEIPFGTLNSIIRQSGLLRADFD